MENVYREAPPQRVRALETAAGDLPTIEELQQELTALADEHGRISREIVRCLHLRDRVVAAYEGRACVIPITRGLRLPRRTG